MLNLAIFLGAMIVPLAVWGLILRSMAKAAATDRPPRAWGFEAAEVERLSPEEKREEERAQTRYVNALYEDDFNHHRAA